MYLIAIIGCGPTTQVIKKPKFDEVTMVYPKGYTGEEFY